MAKKNEQSNDLFNKLAAAENEFFQSQLFSPVIKGSPIRVRIANIVTSLHVAQPKNFVGWGVFRPITYKTVKFIREPNMAEKQEYFKLFPALRLILCSNNDGGWFGVNGHKADKRFNITGLVPVQLATEVQMFDAVKVRYDGANIWFEQIDQRANPRTAIYLRESLQKLLDPAKLEFSGLTQEEKEAYWAAYLPALAADEEARRDKNEDRIKDALKRAGAQYKSYIERGNTYTVEYTVDGRQHRSVVNKDTLAVESAGICLAGTDRNFDLQSLVGVIREGERGHRIVRVDNNYDEDDW